MPAPDFTLTDLEGQSFKLSDLKGKVVFLDFWATWCPPCVVSVPAVSELDRRYPELEVVSLSLDESTGPVRSFVSRHKVQNRVALVGQSGVDTRYRIQSIPSFFLVDRKGNIVRIWHGFRSSMSEEWSKEIEQLLGT